uniref:Putative ubiquitin-like protein 4a n=1 Tax=Xenopsylla cheopis TaxID=163159 RepID=A0A6M2DDY4_XENCH
MKILIKVLKGNDCWLEVNKDTTIKQIKTEAMSRLNISGPQQTLLLAGRPLIDENSVEFYDSIQEGTKLLLVIKKQEILNLNDELVKYLKKFYSDDTAQQLAKSFMIEFKRKTALLSLDDIERLASSDIL